MHSVFTCQVMSAGIAIGRCNRSPQDLSQSRSCSPNIPWMVSIHPGCGTTTHCPQGPQIGLSCMPWVRIAALQRHQLGMESNNYTATTTLQLVVQAVCRIFTALHTERPCHHPLPAVYIWQDGTFIKTCRGRQTQQSRRFQSQHPSTRALTAIIKSRKCHNQV